MKVEKKSLAENSTARSSRIFFFLLLTACIATPDRAGAVLAKPLFELQFSGGSRIDQLDWNIAGNINGDNPNILSELTWEDLEISQVSSTGVCTLKNTNSPFGLRIRGTFNYGEITDGKKQDSDYARDDRTFEFFRSNNSSDDGDVWDLTIGVGPVFTSQDKTASASPYIGYSYHEQNLIIRNGYQTLSNQANANLLNPLIVVPATGPFAGLNSTYDAEWQSFVIGLLLEFSPHASFSLHSTVEFHAGTYDADADWNLRDDFRHPVSFRHSSDEAAGVLAAFGVKTGTRNLLFSLDLTYQKWKAEDGIDKTYYADGTTGITRLNEVNWESFSLMAGITFRF